MSPNTGVIGTYWYIGISVYWYIPIYQYTNIPIYLTCSDHPGVWCRKYLARWMKWHSSSRFPSRLSLLWESWQPNKAKVKVELTKVTRVTEVNFGSKFFFDFLAKLDHSKTFGNNFFFFFLVENIDFRPPPLTPPKILNLVFCQNKL